MNWVWDEEPHDNLMNPGPASLPPDAETSGQQPSLVRGLTLLDSVLLLVSGIIGSSIFLTAKDIAGPLPNPTLFFLACVPRLLRRCAGPVAPSVGRKFSTAGKCLGGCGAFFSGWFFFPEGIWRGPRGPPPSSWVLFGTCPPFNTTIGCVFSGASTPFN